ncbi:DUF6221 family protein [Qaidamihabitans albus]|uniref:DUF6221 family protein n=1 Tax=Qaidamihabitans albus TaxID=2795733 RepID=UPI0018F15781|nr:DUF6221 family protein [Qaidamihabitans albus]
MVTSNDQPPPLEWVAAYRAAMVNDLITFLRARLGELEQKAPDVHEGRCAAHHEQDRGYEYHPEWCDCGRPDRERAHIEAKRRIIEMLTRYERAIQQGESETARPSDSIPAAMYAARDGLDQVIRLHAAAHADHPDYREEWRP